MRIDLIDPIIRKIASRFNVSPTEREDLIQEGYLKVLAILKEDPEKDFESEEGVRILKACVSNAMTDVLRKRVVRFSREKVLEDGSGFLAHDDEFKKMAEQESLRELSLFLSDIEKRVLKEIYEPS